MKQFLIYLVFAWVLFAPVTVISQNTNESSNEEQISESDKKCYETCLKNGYDESECKGICYSEIKNESEAN